MTVVRRLRRILPQVVLLAFFGLIQLLSRIDAIPPPDEILGHLERWLLLYGLWAVAALSFVENLPGINVHFPGSVAILAVVASGTGYADIGLLFLAIGMPAAAANLACFRIGRLNSDRLAKSPNGRSLFWFYLGTYWHPQFASLTAIASGASGVPIRHHLRYFLPISLGWVLLWVILIRSIGEAINFKGNVFYLTMTYLLVWLLWGALDARQRAV